MRIGSLCSGYDGISLGLEMLFDVEHAFFADPDPAATAILAHHWPEVPNLGDISTVDWATVPPVDMLTAGYPCQPFSLAGKRKGAEDERHLWPHVAVAVGALRPSWVLLENVAAHLGLGFDAVLADLAALRYDACWCLVRASDTGAPHRRERLFVLAATDTPRLGRSEGRAEPARRVWGPTPGVSGPPTADTDSERGDGRGIRGVPVGAGRPRDAAAHAAGQRSRPAVGSVGTETAGRVPRDHRPDYRSEPATADTDGAGLEGHRRLHPAPREGETPAHDPCGMDWGPYGAAVARWERVLGRPAPPPTEPGRLARRRRVQVDDAQRPVLDVAVVADRVRVGRPPARDELNPQPGEGVHDGSVDLLGGDVAEGDCGDDGGVSVCGHGTDAPSRHGEVKRRLSPLFVEWIMGLPAGHVTAVPGLTRANQLKALGNGVVPAQAALAVRLLLDLHHQHQVAAL